MPAAPDAEAHDRREAAPQTGEHCPIEGAAARLEQANEQEPERPEQRSNQEAQGAR